MVYNFDGSERHIVIDCPKCSTTIWAGATCPTCAKRKAVEGIIVGGPEVDTPRPKAQRPLRGGL